MITYQAKETEATVNSASNRLMFTRTVSNMHNSYSIAMVCMAYSAQCTLHTSFGTGSPICEAGPGYRVQELTRSRMVI